jgi:hypothetical protein
MNIIDADDAKVITVGIVVVLVVGALIITMAAMAGLAVRLFDLLAGV